MAARWTKEEDKLLKEIYPSNLKQDIINKTGKPWPTIHRRAVRLKLRRDPKLINQDRKNRGPRKDAWTPEEEKLLKEIFENNTKKAILEKINRPWAGIYLRANRLGLVRNPEIVKQEMIVGGKSAPTKKNVWTTEEDNLLKEIYGKKRKKEIQERFNRSWSAIRGRAIKLGVTRDKKLVRLDNAESTQTAMFEKYGVKSSFELVETQEKVRNSYKKNLGVDFPMQSESVKAKARMKYRKKYGVDNPFQSAEIKEKSQNSMFERHGVKSPLQSIDIRIKALESLKKKGSSDISDSEANFYFHLRAIDPETEHQVLHPFTGNRIDFYMPKFNVWVQYDGDYWHGHINRTHKGDRSKSIANTIKNDQKQNLLIPNLVRFKETEILNAIKKDNLNELIRLKLQEKSKIDFSCHQYRMKSALLSSDIQSLNFDYKKLKASDFILQQEEFNNEIVEFIQKYEWLGTVGTTPKWCFTARYEGKLAATVLINEPTAYSKMLGDHTSNYEALIQRGASASWTPKNTGSRLIAFSCNWMVQNTNKRLFVGYGDPKAHEIGTIYQACNFEYVGNNFGTSYLYINPKIKGGKPFSAQSLKRTSSFRRWLRENEIDIQPGWIKPNGYKNLSMLPAQLKENWNKWIKDTLNSSTRIATSKKHKYALLSWKNKKEKKELLALKNYHSKKYPKRGKVDPVEMTEIYADIALKGMKKPIRREKVKSRISPEKEKFIINHYEKLTQAEIAETMGETKRWVSGRIRSLVKRGLLKPKNGVGSTKSRITKEKVDFIKKNRATMSYSEMAETLKENKRWIKRQINNINKS